MLDVLFDFILNTFFYKTGLRVIKIITRGRFKDDNPYYLYLIALVGMLFWMLLLLGIILIYLWSK